MPGRISKIPTRLIPLLLLITIAACAPTPTQQVLITQTPLVVAQLSTADLTAVAQAVTRTPGPILMVTPDANAASAMPTFDPQATLEPDALVISSEGVLLRSGAGEGFESVYAPLPVNTSLRLVAVSSDTLWYQVEAFTGEHGWVPNSTLILYSALSDLPVVEVAAPTAAPTIEGEVVPVIAIPSLSAQDVQPLPTADESGVLVTNRMREIFQKGQEMGNDPRVFIKVGDSTTEQQAFMIGFGTGEYNLGSYTHLQAAIDYFSRDAFTRDSLASESAFNSASVLDSFRVPDEGKDVCQPGEKPLECEIRVMKPAFAFILFGGNEVRSFDMGLDVYGNQIQQLIDVSTTRGVIPILTTFPHSPDFHENAAAYNQALRDIAADQKIPLIDLENAVLPLPNGGVSEEDGFHMSMRGIRGDITDNQILLNGEEQQYGATLRNLLTLQMLDALRLELGLQ